jgi:hypothetical protein
MYLCPKQKEEEEEEEVNSSAFASQSFIYNLMWLFSKSFGTKRQFRGRGKLQRMSLRYHVIFGGQHAAWVGLLCCKN